jgi:predicted Na+-dependent transporter
VVVFSLLGILKERDALIDGFVQVGSAILLFNALCLGLGFWAARLLRFNPPFCSTIAFQAGQPRCIPSR